MEKSHYKYFKRVLLTEQPKPQRIFNYFAIVIGVIESVIGWISIVK